MSVHDLFSDADLMAIKKAAGRAELRTAGEVVTFVVERSDRYPEAPLRGALLGGCIGLAAAFAWLNSAAPWGTDPLAWSAALGGAGAVAAYALVGFVPLLRRTFAGRAAIDKRVGRRAAAAFLEEEVFDTRARTGMLLFISRFEHRVVVLGDSGINAKVEPGAWAEIAGRLAAGIKAGRAAAAVIEAIEACGRLLEAAGVARRDDDVDELTNEVRLRDA